MAKKLLSLDEVGELGGHFRDALKVLGEIKSRNAIADKIKNVQIPSSLSESLAVHFIRDNFPEFSEHSLSLDGFRKNPDIWAIKGNERKKIEVKATGEKAFQRLGKKDIEADFLIWIHFDNFFFDESKKDFEVFVLRNPSKCFSEVGTIKLEKFKRLAGLSLEKFSFSL